MHFDVYTRDHCPGQDYTSAVDWFFSPPISPISPPPHPQIDFISERQIYFGDPLLRFHLLASPGPGWHVKLALHAQNLPSLLSIAFP